MSPGSARDEKRWPRTCSARERGRTSPEHHNQRLGSSREIHLGIEAGWLTILLPTDLAVPKTGSLEIDFLGEGGFIQRLSVPTVSSPLAPDGIPTWASGRCELGRLEAGAYEVTVIAYETKLDTSRPPPSQLRTTLRSFPRTHILIARRAPAILDLRG